MLLHKTILVVDDDAVFTGTLKLALHTLDKYVLHIVVAASKAQAMQVLESNTRIDLVIADLILPDGHGTELITFAQSITPPIRGIVVTGMVLTPSFLEMLSKAGIYECFIKGLHLSTLETMIVTELNKGSV